MRTISRLTDVKVSDAAPGDLTGADGQFVTGTAGSSGNVVEWNGDGDAVDSGASTAALTAKAAQTLSFGATLDAAGNFAIANGAADAADAASGSTTRHGALGGTINRVAFLHAGDLSTNNATIKIHVNGSSAGSFTASAGANSVDVATGLGLSVNDGDIVEVEFDAGSTNPGASVVTVMIE